jgi:hypothetical protein
MCLDRGKERMGAKEALMRSFSFDHLTVSPFTTQAGVGVSKIVRST